MRNFITIALLLTVTNIFGQGGQKEFPDNIQSSKTSKHTRIKGTRVFVSVPAGYAYVPSLGRYQKRDDLYFQVTEVDNRSFETAKASFTRAAIEAKGVRVDAYKNVHVNQLDGVYTEGPSKIAGQEKAIFAFGDDHFTVMVIAVFSATDKTAKNELWTIFKSMYFDRNFTPDAFELANFDFDKAITSFKFAASATNLYMYTENGPGDAENGNANGFIFSTLPKMDEHDAINLSTNILANYERKGMVLDDNKVTPATVGSYHAVVVSSKISLNGHSGIMYQVVLLGDKSSLLFAGRAFNNAAGYLEKYKRTAASVRLK